MGGQAVPLAEFGAWKKRNKAEALHHFLLKAGIAPDELISAGIRQREFFDPTNPLRSWSKVAERSAALRSYAISRNSPWTFDDGAVNDLEYGGEIVMFVGPGSDDWESYSAAARSNAVSNYQFSGVSEWFAEAYAAYYNPDPNAASRDRLSGAQRDWFARMLGPHVSDRDFNQDGGYVVGGKLTDA